MTNVKMYLVWKWLKQRNKELNCLILTETTQNMMPWDRDEVHFSSIYWFRIKRVNLSHSQSHPGPVILPQLSVYNPLNVASLICMRKAYCWHVHSMKHSQFLCKDKWFRTYTHSFRSPSELQTTYWMPSRHSQGKRWKWIQKDNFLCYNLVNTPENIKMTAPNFKIIVWYWFSDSIKWG
jgi:hypothetical protein